MWLLAWLGGASRAQAPPVPAPAPPAPSSAAAEASVPSPDLAEEADLQFKLGIKAYLAGKYDTALEHLLASNRLVPNRNVVFNIGMAYVQLGNYDAAYRHLAAFIEGETREDLVREARATIDRFAAEVALVRVESDPPGAEVYVDRRDLGMRGRTPIVLALPPGDHELLIERPGYVPVSLETAAERGGSKTVTTRLEAILGAVRLDGTPIGAEVRLEDGSAVVGILPATLPLPPGSHLVRVTAPGFVESRQVVEVRPNEVSAITVDLEAVRGRLLVDALVPEALIEVDGVASGFTPATLELPVGKHVVRITHQGYRPLEQTIAVSAGSEVRIQAGLRPLGLVSGASRRPESIEEAPASITIIDRDEIRAFGYQELYDAVAGTRGIFQTNDLTYEYLGFRGFSRPGDYGNRVLTSLDGHVMNDDQVGASYVGNDFLTDLRDIHHIEVIRGPESALYGSNAFLGVLNLVTWSHEQPPPPHVSITADQGRTLRGRAGAGFGAAGRGGWLSVAGLTGRGSTYAFPELAGQSSLAPDGVVDGQDDDESATAAASAWIGDLTIEAFFNGRRKEYPYPGYQTRLADPRAAVRDTRGFAEIRFEPSLSSTTHLSTRAYLDSYTFRGQYPYFPRLYVDDWVGWWAGFEPRITVDPRPWLGLTAGVEVKRELAADMTSRVYPRTVADDPIAVNLDEQPSMSTLSAYAGARLGPDAATLHLAGRFDHIDLPEGAADPSVDALSPRVALVSQATRRATFKALFGGAFRAPSPYEYLYDDGGQTQLQPTNLTPERVWSGEGEWSQSWGDATTSVLSLYTNQIDHLVDLTVLDDGVLQYANVDDPTRTLGGEAELRRDWQGGWMSALQGSVQRTATGAVLNGERITNSPLFVGSMKAAAPVLPGVATLASRLVVESPRRTAPIPGTPGDGGLTDWALVWDATLSGNAPGLAAQWALGVRNLLDWDVEHPAPPGEPVQTLQQPGRTLLFSITAAVPQGSRP